MDLLAAFRRVALLVTLAVLVAGCAEPPAENRPVDLNRDGDLDGIPDGNSPVEGANEPEGNMTNETNETLPGILPPTPPTA